MVKAMGKMSILPKSSVRLVKGPALPWKRVLAFCIDLIVLDLVAVEPFRELLLKIIPKGAGFMDSYNYLMNNGSASALALSVTVAVAIIAMLYFILLEYKLGQTLGKMMMNIKVESVGADAKEGIRFWQAALRSVWLVPVFPFFPLLWIIDPLYILFTKERRRFSEVISRTQTIDYYQV